MSFLEVPHVRIVGMAATVPADKKDNLSDPLVEDGEKILKNVGIRYRHVASEETCASDLCIKAASDLLNKLQWSSEEIDCLVFVRQTPDYVLPSSAFLIQEKLGISSSCFCIDLALGCSGYVYGLSTISALMQSGSFHKGLLLVGDTISRTCSKQDKSTYPLFGDAGTATALQFDPNASSFKFQFGADGTGKDAIIIPEGAFRKPFTASSLEVKEVEDGIARAGNQLVLDGMDVFSFGISKGPQSVQELAEHFEIDLNTVDIFAFHQANLFMNEKIRKKLKLPEEKVPYSLEQFGNTSCATIPLTLISQRRHSLEKEQKKIIACGFGVGLSWASVYLELENIVIPEISYL